MSGLLAELGSAGLYKPRQGRYTRQVTFGVVAVAVFLGLWRLSDTLNAAYPGSNTLRYAVPGVLLLAGWWLCYRLVNYPAFADFLIAVEAEMNKVSWPSRGELVRASIVVLLTIIALGFILAAFDAAWIWIFRNVLRLY